MQNWFKIFCQIFSWHFLHQISRMEVFDVEFLKKRVGENDGICRVEPRIEDVRVVCLVLEIRLSQTGLKSFGSISEPKIKGKALKLALLKTAHHMPHINRIHQKRKFCLLSKATFIHWISPKKLLCE